MKPATLLYALGLAQMGLAMPVPMTISDMVAHVKGEARRLTRITRVSMHRKRPVAIIQEAEDAGIEIEFDNHPISPSRSLSKHPQASKDRVVDVEGDGMPETIKPMSLEEGLAELLPSNTRIPCWKHVQVPRPTIAIFEQHPDLIVLGAVIALVLVLLVLETVGTTFQGVRRHYSPQGQIRLEGDEKACKAPSFRSDAVPYDEEQLIERRES